MEHHCNCDLHRNEKLSVMVMAETILIMEKQGIDLGDLDNPCQNCLGVFFVNIGLYLLQGNKNENFDLAENLRDVANRIGAH